MIKIRINREMLLQYFGLAALIMLPLSVKLTNLFFILYLIIIILFVKKEELLRSIKSYQELLYINAGPFVFCLISLLYTSSVDEGLFAIEKYLPLLILPFVLASYPELDRALSMKTFAIAVVSICILSVIWNIYNFLVHPSPELYVGDLFNRVETRWNRFTHKNLVDPFQINPIYLSLYACFSIVVIHRYFKYQVLSISLTLFLSCYVLLLSSRLGMITLFVTLVFLFLKNIRKSVILSFFLLSIVFIFIFIYNPILQKRYVTEFFNYKFPSSVYGWNGLNLRLSIWDCSVKSFKESPIIGYGVGGHKEVRKLCYTDYSWYGPYGTDYNSHNQFLEYLLIGGSILVILFGIQLYYAFNYALKSKDLVHIIFLSQFLIFCLGESILETHKGIVFFSYFNSLFLVTSKSKICN